MDAIAELIESGAKPLELTYEGVYGERDFQVCAYRSELWVKSLDLGVLTPEQYLPVALRTTLCVELAMWNLEQLCEELQLLEKKTIPFEWISLSMPIRALMKGDLVKKLKAVFSEKGLEDPSLICLEFPIELLYEEHDKAVAYLQELKQLGVKTCLTDFGNSYCPVLRLSGLPVDFVLLDSCVAKSLQQENHLAAKSVIDFSLELGFCVIASGVENQKQMELCGDFGCDYMVGKISGKRKKASSIRV